MHNSHTHCQVAQANTQPKTWQRVCLFQRTTDRHSTRKTEGHHPTAHWRIWRVQWQFELLYY